MSKFFLARFVSLLGVSAALLSITGCATPVPKDYTAFKESNPRSIIVLPPINKSPEVNATIGFYANVSKPIAESGFYVFPPSLVYETFKQNGFDIPDEIHNIDPKEIKNIFGADAAMYVVIKEYGTKFLVFSSVTIVAAEAKLVDLTTGVTIWQGRAVARSDEAQNNNQAGLAGLLVQALVTQIMATSMDQSFQYAGLASHRLFSGSQPNGLLYGPYHPEYGKAKQ